MIPSPKTLSGQIWAYIFGGGAMTMLHSLCYWLLAERGHIDASMANSVAAIIAGLCGYFLHSRWTFRHTNEIGNSVAARFRFIAVSAMCYALNSLWVWLFVDWLELGVNLSIVPMVLITPWLGFVLNRYWTFAR